MAGYRLGWLWLHVVKGDKQTAVNADKFETVNE